MSTDRNVNLTEAKAVSDARAVSADRRSPYHEMRRYIRIGGLYGNLVFLVTGIWVGFFYGGLGGTRFFEELFLIKQAGSVATIVGSFIGVLMGLVCVWAITVVTFALSGALLYWLQYKRLPLPPA